MHTLLARVEVMLTYPVIDTHVLSPSVRQGIPYNTTVSCNNIVVQVSKKPKMTTLVLVDTYDLHKKGAASHTPYSACSARFSPLPPVANFVQKN